MRIGLPATLILVLALSRAEAAPPIKIVAAENFYGDIARQIGGEAVQVTSILSNPNQDPHLFEASPSTARALADADIVVYNGADYDPWMVNLLGASSAPNRIVIVAADLVHRKPGDNPHLWYDPATVPAVAKALAAALDARDPADAARFDRRRDTVLASLAPLAAKIAALKAKYAGIPVTASEPVFGYMADAIGLAMRNGRFQIAIMNDTEPSASDVAAFENDLKSRAVRVLFYNNQVSDPTVERLLGIARDARIPVVGVSETEPLDKTYQAWMLGQLDALDDALSAKP
jgi:zinc/manganese transport system substrate-binding protein